ncbi:DUF6734 family protein [Aquimarina gracilis]|uniref:DUF6734 family protein n=1 Tax=Aquimarina gracilis TaxID=874422 RepID=A0ABU5ZU79_9FLAO|nr:DUF6734 family protein [Aquimarina gracilis]MEB3345641.1 DUF6734 family protein [Aquimarina gracilis]
MKIIQTLWTKPGIEGGWIHEKYHFISWAYSCLQLKKHYDQVELYTDSYGKYILKDLLNLPYTKVHTNLDDFDYPTYLWAAPKILSYGLQDEPFLHVDGDVYITEPMDEKILEHPLVYQNKEIEFQKKAFYSLIFEEIQQLVDDKSSLPDWISNVNMNNVVAFNAGVFGGTDVSFFKEHSELAFKFFSEYKDVIKRMKTPAYANHIAEQVLSNYLTKKHDTIHKGFFDARFFMDEDSIKKSKTKDKDPIGYYTTDHFGVSPYGKKYIHYIGKTKQSIREVRALTRRLYIDYPEYYGRIMNLNSKKVEEKYSFNDAYQDDLEAANTTTISKSSIKNAIVKVSCKYTFSKTIYMYKRIIDSSFALNISPNDFIDFFESKQHQINGELVNDVFHYEKQVFEYVTQLYEDEVYIEREQQTSAFIDKIYAYDQPDIDNYEIGFNGYLGIVRTKWEWANNQVDPMSNMSIDPKGALTILTPDFITKRIYQESLTNLNQIIVYVFDSPKTYNEGFEQILEFVNTNDLKIFKKQVFECIAYLITNNILVVNPKK